MNKFLALLCLVVAVPLSALSAPWPDYQSVYVNDFADVLDDATEADLTEHLTAIRDNHGVEMTVVTISTIDDFDAAASWEAFATRLFNGWGIGDPERNDGVLFLFAMTDRNMRLEVGSGFHGDWDNATKDIIDSIMVPNFKNGDVNGGVTAGVRTMIARINTNIAEGRAATDTPYGQQTVSGTSDDTAITDDFNDEPKSTLSWIWYTLILPVLAGGAFLVRRFIRMRPRDCQACGTRMQLLDEARDDAYLDEGSQLEESINSVDYDVWSCPSCGHAHIERWRNWLSRYGACRACNFRSLESDTRILRSATTSSEGLKEITYNCVHCNETWMETKRIPRRSNSSSSSSSSFSGGSSSGGGSSGSW
ncbi:MAG: YgcG family protein [Paracoccaceae bacterium]